MAIKSPPIKDIIQVEPVNPCATNEILVNDYCVYDGFVLFTPFDNNALSHKTYLMDKSGQVINEWDVPAPPASAPYLTRNGELVYPCKQDEMIVPYAAGAGGRIVMYGIGKHH